MLFTSNPFERLDPGAARRPGPQPAAAGPGARLPSAVPLSRLCRLLDGVLLRVAALIEGRVDAAWARWVRPWTLAAWAALTLGIALGSWWAYYELGWGGWWFWDPVENASFMPWLAGDGAAALGDRGREARRAEELDDPARDPGLLAVAARHLPGALGRADLGARLRRRPGARRVHPGAARRSRSAARSRSTPGARRRCRAGGLFAPVSREGAWCSTTCCSRPPAPRPARHALSAAARGASAAPRSRSARPTSTSTFVPLMVPLLIAIGGGPDAGLEARRPRRRARHGCGRRCAIAAVALLRAARRRARGADCSRLAPSARGLAHGRRALGARRARAAAAAAAGAQPGSAPRLPRAARRMTLAHLGVGVLVAGVTALERLAERGDPGDAAGRDAQSSPATTSPSSGIEDRARGRTTSRRRAIVEVTRDGSPVATLIPEKRYYPVERPADDRGRRSTPGFWRDLYVVLGDPAERCGGRARDADLRQPAGDVDLGRRADHGLAGLHLAERSPPPGRRAAPGARTPGAAAPRLMAATGA